MAGEAPPRAVGRYVEPKRIRSLGVVEYVACREPTGEPRVLVAARDGASPTESGALIAEIARVHRLLDVPGVPAVVELDDAPQPSFVAFDCDGTHDFETLVGAVIEGRDAPRPVDAPPPFMLSHEGASSYAIAQLELLDRVHATVDPTTGKPVCMGVFSAMNFLASPTGRTWTLGFGHPWRGVARAQLLADTPAGFLAPEAAFGIPPSPGGDLAAVSLYLHSFDRVGEMPQAITHALAGGETGPELGERLAALMMNAHATRPDDRSIRRFLADFHPTLVLLRITPSAERFASDLRAAIALHERRVGGGAALRVATDGRWCQPPGGDVVSLERRGAMRRLVVALAEARRDAPGQALSWEDLLRAGWPSERPGVEAAKNRVYVAVAQLRALGFRDVLLRHDAGYLLDPAVPVVWASSAPDA